MSYTRVDQLLMYDLNYGIYIYGTMELRSIASTQHAYLLQIHRWTERISTDGGLRRIYLLKKEAQGYRPLLSLSAQHTEATNSEDLLLPPTCTSTRRDGALCPVRREDEEECPSPSLLYSPEPRYTGRVQQLYSRWDVLLPSYSRAAGNI